MIYLDDFRIGMGYGKIEYCKEEEESLYLLKAAKLALNACPMHLISHDNFNNSYDVVAAISEYINKYNERK